MRAIVTACLVLSLCVTPCLANTAELLQDKPVAPLSTTAIGEIAPIIVAVMQSNMDAGAKERTVQAMSDLAKLQIETQAKTTESKWTKVFDITVKLISLGASIFAVVKVTS